MHSDLKNALSHTKICVNVIALDNMIKSICLCAEMLKRHFSSPLLKSHRVGNPLGVFALFGGRIKFRRGLEIHMNYYINIISIISIANGHFSFSDFPKILL